MLEETFEKNNLQNFDEIKNFLIKRSSTKEKNLTISMSDESS